MVTNRATQAEKAQAWDMLMESTGSDAKAIQRAWTWLRDQVNAREAGDPMPPPVLVHDEHCDHDHTVVMDTRPGRPATIGVVQSVRVAPGEHRALAPTTWTVLAHEYQRLHDNGFDENAAVIGIVLADKIIRGER